MFIQTIGLGWGALALLASPSSNAQSLGDILGEVIGGDQVWQHEVRLPTHGY
jgi:hypothetical protein